MRTWRLLLDVSPQLWNYVVAARDHLEAWQIALEDLPARDRGRATLEEMECTYDPPPETPGIIKVWPLCSVL